MRNLKTLMKINYGIGQISDGVMHAAWTGFLVFYYHQVLGLPGKMAGLAALLALVIDAVTDPMVGHLSDRLKSKFGRRHPLMLLGVLPFLLAMIALFSPPGGLSTWALFAWLLTFAILLRLALTLFYVPHLSLGAEIEQDYHHKTSLIGYRIFFAYFGVLFVSVIGFMVFFPATAVYTNGLLNPAGYANFGLFCGLLAASAMLWCVFSTKSLIPSLSQPTETINILSSLLAFMTLAKTLKLPSFRVLFFILVMITTLAGVNSTLMTYLGIYVFDFSAEEIGLINASIILGLLLASLIAQTLSKRYDKKKALAVCLIVGSVVGFSPSFLYLAGFFEGIPWAVKFLLVFLANGISQAFFIALIILLESMLSDCIDVNEYQTGMREEGVFFAARSFATKASFGLGSFFAGVALDIVALPQGAKPEDVAPETAWELAFFTGPIMACLFLSVYFLIRLYDLDAKRHKEIMTEMAAAKSRL
ncbi:MFS transporter [Temperatibacter marinus]|uniref:MFS transporter n=1 Tax=Temperatibacter marinus TaxID=1456591 RepID=A0AA52HA62_9PROT|nr:MFS transporter [Temperatibacter marinus]WND03292.1 MFS transporter [Temperatibacter marinus]